MHIGEGWHLPLETSGSALLHNGRQDELPRSLADGGHEPRWTSEIWEAGECINWVSKPATVQMSVKQVEWTP